MANVYLDMSLGTGANDGTSWINAYQAFSSLVAAAGDDVWVKGTESIAAAVTKSIGAADINNRVRIHGCKSATSATPPAQSDLIPGWRTGESRTVANRAYKDADAPTLTVTGAGNDLTLSGYAYVYGMVFVTADNTVLNDSWIFEECHLDTGNGELGSYTFGGTNANDYFEFINCETEHSTTGGVYTNARIARVTFRGHVFTYAGASGNPFTVNNGYISFIGCDFSAGANTIVSISTVEPNATIEITNCQYHASTVLRSGTVNNEYLLENHLSANVTGKSSGSLKDIEIAQNTGDIVQETTAVRARAARTTATAAGPSR
jgi:hypothetical protein